MELAQCRVVEWKNEVPAVNAANEHKEVTRFLALC